MIGAAWLAACEIEKVAIQIENSLKNVRGTRSAYADRVTGGYFLDFDINRAEAARYGLTVGRVQDVIESAIGGLPVSQTVEGRERYGVRIRYPQELRDNPERLASVLVPVVQAQDQSLVLQPLAHQLGCMAEVDFGDGQVASVRLARGSVGAWHDVAESQP